MAAAAGTADLATDRRSASFRRPDIDSTPLAASSQRGFLRAEKRVRWVALAEVLAYVRNASTVRHQGGATPSCTVPVASPITQVTAPSML